MIRQYRRTTASSLVFLVFTTTLVILPLFMVLYQYNVYVVDKQRLQNVVEAAGLLAANDMSRIIINDPNVGFVSLSNHPPIGRVTCAPDGDPLPVIGINTLVGTVRQNSIIAGALNNQTMSSLVHADRSALNGTIARLNSALNDALTGVRPGDFIDIHGEPVDPIEDVTAFLTANLPANMELESVKLSSGWLAGGSTTTTPLPRPAQLAEVHKDDCQNGNYKGFIDVPVDRQSFTFAGLGPSSSLVSPSEFQEYDNEHICSIVRIECTVVRKDRQFMPFGLSLCSRLQGVVCCQPFSLPDSATCGAMTLRFSGAPAPGLRSWREFLQSANFQDSQIVTYDVAGGDYPFDRDAHMNQSKQQVQTSTSQQFAEHLYYWLRNGHGRPRIDAVLGMIYEPFDLGADEVYVYEFAGDGFISRTVARDPFPTGVTADAQFSAVVDTSIQGGITPVIVFRNNVKNLGTQSGGKHCGQPLAGYPLSGCELQGYGSYEQLALKFGRRRTYRRGLALDIEIGGIRESTASDDVASMRSRFRSRRI